MDSANFICLITVIILASVVFTRTGIGRVERYITVNYDYLIMGCLFIIGFIIFIEKLPIRNGRERYVTIIEVFINCSNNYGGGDYLIFSIGVFDKGGCINSCVSRLKPYDFSLDLNLVAVSIYYCLFSILAVHGVNSTSSGVINNDKNDLRARIVPSNFPNSCVVLVPNYVFYELGRVCVC